MTTASNDPVADVERALARASVEDAAHIFISQQPDRAGLQAKQSADRHRAGQQASPLDGATMVWKDLFDIAGTRTTAGSLTRAEVPVADVSAPMVQAADAAGMITLGKTNLSEFAFSGLGYNPHFGTPVIASSGGDLMPGGSSSGSAVAVRLGIARIGMGTDTAGSIRVPAAFNGLVGYRASQARYNRSGIFPLGPSFDTAGPMAKSVADCVLVDAVLRSSRAVAPAAIGNLHFIVDTALLNDPTVADAVRTNLKHTMQRLARSGARISERALSTPSAVLSLIADYGWPGGYEAFVVHQKTLESAAADLIDPRVATRMRAAGQTPPERHAFVLAERLRLQTRMLDELAGAVLVTPTVAHTAPLFAPLIADRDLFAKTNLATLRFTMIASLLDMPTVAMLSGYNGDGHATSFSLSTPKDSDDHVLAAALAAETALAT